MWNFCTGGGGGSYLYTFFIQSKLSSREVFTNLEQWDWLQYLRISKSVPTSLIRAGEYLNINSYIPGTAEHGSTMGGHGQKGCRTMRLFLLAVRHPCASGGGVYDAAQFFGEIIYMHFSQQGFGVKTWPGMHEIAFLDFKVWYSMPSPRKTLAKLRTFLLSISIFLWNVIANVCL